MCGEPPLSIHSCRPSANRDSPRKYIYMRTDRINKLCTSPLSPDACVFPLFTRRPPLLLLLLGCNRRNIKRSTAADERKKITEITQTRRAPQEEIACRLCDDPVWRCAACCCCRRSVKTIFHARTSLYYAVFFFVIKSSADKRCL